MDNQAELDMLLSKIKENSLLLLKEHHSSNVLYNQQLQEECKFFEVLRNLNCM